MHIIACTIFAVKQIIQIQYVEGRDFEQEKALVKSQSCYY